MKFSADSFVHPVIDSVQEPSSRFARELKLKDVTFVQPLTQVALSESPTPKMRQQQHVRISVQTWTDTLAVTRRV